MGYSVQSLDVLRKYCNMPPIIKPDKINLGEVQGTDFYEVLHVFFFKGRLPSWINDKEDLQNFLSDIETLYEIACKYGSTHDFPVETLYREDTHYRIMQNWGNGKWITNSFKSFSFSKEIADTFKSEGISRELVIDGVARKVDSSRRIPFINVNDLIGTEHEMADEKEIIIPPCQELVMGCEIKDTDDSVTGWHFAVTPNFITPKISEKKITEMFGCTKEGLSDMECELIVELLRKERMWKLEADEKEKLNNYRDVLRYYIITRCKGLHKLYMEEVRSDKQGVKLQVDTVVERNCGVSGINADVNGLMRELGVAERENPRDFAGKVRI